MATLQPLWTRATLDQPDAIRAFLADRGIAYERWELPDEARDLGAQPTLSSADKQRLLDLFEGELEARRGDLGFETADVVVVRAAFPGVDDALAKFDRVHYHDDDEIRAIVGGSGIFGFVGDDGRQFLLTVEAGDFISVPSGVWHWFYTHADKNITALRLFKDPAGWVANYRDTARGGV